MRQQDTTIARTKQGFWKVFLGLFHKTVALTNTHPLLSLLCAGFGGWVCVSALMGAVFFLLFLFFVGVKTVFFFVLRPLSIFARFHHFCQILLVLLLFYPQNSFCFSVLPPQYFNLFYPFQSFLSFYFDVVVAITVAIVVAITGFFI